VQSIVALKNAGFILADVQSYVLSPSHMHITAFSIDQQLRWWHFVIWFPMCQWGARSSRRCNVISVAAKFSLRGLISGEKITRGITVKFHLSLILRSNGLEAWKQFSCRLLVVRYHGLSFRRRGLMDGLSNCFCFCWRLS